MDNYIEDSDTRKRRYYLESDWKSEIKAKALSWTGYENITFTATDPSGLVGFQTATFTIQESGFIMDFNHNDMLDTGDLIIGLQTLSGFDNSDDVVSPQVGMKHLLFLMNQLIREEQ